jgi:hypothetical protein
MKKTSIAILGIALLVGNAFADEASGLGVGVKVGTLGLGLEGVKSVNSKLDLRLGLNKFNYDANKTLDGTEYKAKLDMQTVSALADWHPAGSGFLLSGGAMLNNNKLDASATVSTTKPVTIGDNTKPVTIGDKTISSGVVNTSVSFDDVSPYLGIGYRKPAHAKKGWSFAADAGVLFQGNPKVSLTESTNTVSQTDIDKEITKVRKDLDALKNMPVVSLGAVYNF